MRLIIASLLLWGGLSPAQDRWPQHKGDCEDVFQGWRVQSLESLRGCLMRWEMYRDMAATTSSQKKVAREAFEKLYAEGDERDAFIALSALKRMGFRPRKLRDEAAPEVDSRAGGPTVRLTEAPREGGLAPKGMHFEPEGGGAEPPMMGERAPDRAAAERAFTNGNEHYRGNRYGEALSEYLLSADSDPTYAKPLYMAARCAVKLRAPKDAIHYLLQMRDIDSEEARQLLTKAGSDPAFSAMARSGAFKDVTGTAIVQILNGVGERGLKIVKDYEKALSRAGFSVAKVGNDRYHRTAKIIYTKPGFERQGEEIRRQLQMGLVHKKPIEWPSRYDVIVVYGDNKGKDWVDDEAEKNGQQNKEKEEAEKKAKEKKAQEDMAKKAKMREQVEMMKMLQDMNAGEAAKQADPTGGDPINAVPLPP
ncbi:LytR C-terminal domain-containing protein [Myxococcota bacterium]|nr:LytR C-terminal domain-containing protein [Myxococcota bacterium]MBU1433261.1 LytR C-terminal domain-containing protein [Myxococcota bacterium]MBU1897922.1 LytR C-terminal domain-containing protein [Myxococcota bacterium]